MSKSKIVEEAEEGLWKQGQLQDTYKNIPYVKKKGQCGI